LVFSHFQTTPTFWKEWHDFEVRHGNEDTFREMLRIKRSVQAQFNTQVSSMNLSSFGVLNERGNFCPGLQQRHIIKNGFQFFRFVKSAKSSSSFFLS